MTPEDEEFNRVEMESRIKQEYVRAMRKTTREEKISRPAVYEVPTETVLQMRDYIRYLENAVRELNDRVKEMESASNTLDEMRRRYDDHFAKALKVKK
jgi:crotonobetainyl-CoA:carnitine CoA-transferase CaiB-like acyl-CoA transferase